MHGFVISTAFHVPIHTSLPFGIRKWLRSMVRRSLPYYAITSCPCLPDYDGATDMGYERSLDAHGWICCSAAIHPVFPLRVQPLKLSTVRRSRSLREVVYAMRDGAWGRWVSAVHINSNNCLEDNIGLHVARHLEDLGRTVSYAMPQCVYGCSSNATRCQ